LTIRRTPEDFRVEELTSGGFRASLLPEWAPSNPFAAYRLEKISLATPDAIGFIARDLRVPRAAVCAAGLKDRHALTSQTITVDSAALRVPLRMVTTALVAEMERAVQEQGRQQFIGRDSQFLYRAIPSERWLASLEPSVATRARAACIGIATIADETDQALALLDAAIAAPKSQAIFQVASLISCAHAGSARNIRARRISARMVAS
jgi:hypothetical protein